MKKKESSSKAAAKDSEIRKAVGGQPESDQDAREAGLSSATSADRHDAKATPTKPAAGARGVTKKK